MTSLLDLIENYEEEKNAIKLVWDQIEFDFLKADNELINKFMIRRELSFHDHIKLLGFLCKKITHIKGDIVEIGVWKGKSLAFMERLSNKNCKIIGIDPCELDGQKEELNYFKSKLFPNCDLIINYSHLSILNLLEFSNKIKLLHIDGGHLQMHVFLDFLIYSSFVVPGGFIVFDDYNDFKYSPEVKIAVDQMNNLGLFSNFEVLGVINEFKNSYVLKKL